MSLPDRSEFLLRYVESPCRQRRLFTACPAHRNTSCVRIASVDRVPLPALDRFRKTNLIPRQAALVRDHLVARGNVRVLVFRGTEFRIALGQFVGDENQRPAGSLAGGGREFGVALPAQVAHPG